MKTIELIQLFRLQNTQYVNSLIPAVRYKVVCSLSYNPKSICVHFNSFMLNYLRIRNKNFI